MRKTTRVLGGLDILDLRELIFGVRDVDGCGFCARALGYAIFTEAETWEELRANVREAAALHFEDGPVQPRLVRLHYKRFKSLSAADETGGWLAAAQVVITHTDGGREFIR
jgi:hypothetical protein